MRSATIRAGPPTFIRAMRRSTRMRSGTVGHGSGASVVRVAPGPRRAQRVPYPDRVRVLVTGGAGFIGSHLVDALCDEGADVTVLDNLTTGRDSNLDGRARLVQGSILDADLVDKEVEAADEVFHLAAAVGVRHIVDDPLGSLRTNARGTEHVLDACARHRRQVLLASTSEIYGKAMHVPWREDDDRVLGSTDVARWSYSTAKALDEHLALAACEGRASRIDRPVLQLIRTSSRRARLRVGRRKVRRPGPRR